MSGSEKGRDFPERVTLPEIVLLVFCDFRPKNDDEKDPRVLRCLVLPCEMSSVLRHDESETSWVTLSGGVCRTDDLQCEKLWETKVCAWCIVGVELLRSHDPFFIIHRFLFMRCSLVKSVGKGFFSGRVVRDGLLSF